MSNRQQPRAGRLIGTGFIQEVSPDRQVRARDTFRTAYDNAVATRTHLWIVTMAHNASDVFLDHVDGSGADIPIFDMDTMIGPPAIGCYVCEHSYTPALRGTRCPGEPR